MSRKYTPITSIATQGKVEFVIKIYREDGILGTKEGLFSTHLEQKVEVGHKIQCEAPLGFLKYNGYGVFEFLGSKPANTPVKTCKFKKIGMLAGGTGLNPMFSVI